MGWVRSRLEAQPAGRQGRLAETSKAWNRPEIAEHSRAIGDYLKANFRGKYIIPPLTLNIQQKVNLYTPDYPSEFLPGYLVIPATAKLAITDGQHRRSGIIAALEEMEETDRDKFNRDAIAVMISCETDIKQIHQDFADCSKTKPLPPSMVAVYDTRNPANRLVVDMEQRCPLFRGRIDSTSKTLSKKSTFLFLANQVRQLVKELLKGSYALPDNQFEKLAGELLGTEAQYLAVLDEFCGYINYLTEVIPVWKEIADVKPGTLESSHIPRKREEGWVCLTATGLNIIGRIGYKLTSDKEKRGDWKQYADKLGEIDWKRSADFWQGNIIQGNRLLTQQVPLRNAFDKLCQQIGLCKAPSSAPQDLTNLASEQLAVGAESPDTVASDPTEKSHG